MNYNGHWYFDDDAKAERFQKILFSNGYRWAKKSTMVKHLPSYEYHPVVYQVVPDRIYVGLAENYEDAKQEYSDLRIFHTTIMETE